MSTIIRVTGKYPSIITVGHRLGFKPIYEALDEAVTKALITHMRPLASQAEVLAQYLREQGIEVSTVDHPNAEAGESIEVIASLWDECGYLQLGHKDAIIAMGEGAITDMVGLIAATWLHGITLINVPTALLAMVDAAIGGRTGINTSARKDLVGSFYSATFVVADMDLLESLPTPGLAADTAEVIKCGFITDPEVSHIVEETGPNELLRSYSPQLAETATHAIAIKAHVASADLTRGGLREILNYGHTLARAIEHANDYIWRHGNAIAIGYCFAARLARAWGPLSADDVSRCNQLFSRIGLPTCYEGSTLDEFTHIMLSDKKVRRGALRFVLLDGIANPGTVSVDPQELWAPASQIGIRA